jgi:16S rRNA (uracil1498-N3)-methyltransferase
MKRVLCPNLPKPGVVVEIPADEAKHLLSVFRLKDGDTVEAIDGKGALTVATLRVRGKSALLEAKPSDEVTGNLAKERSIEVVPIVLELAVLKGPAMEWAIEKAVELGIERVTPIITAHTVVQLDRKGPEVFRERWQRIADQALKQCGRLTRLVIDLPESLEEVLRTHPDKTQRYWGNESARDELPTLSQRMNSQDVSTRALHITIGPEGGWSDSEKQLLKTGGQPVSLGPLVLRAETAALFAISVASSHFRGAKLDNNAPKLESSK